LFSESRIHLIQPTFITGMRSCAGETIVHTV
jgi:hypothetical protein